MSRKSKKAIKKAEPKYQGSALKISQQIPGDVYWLTQTELKDDQYYTIGEALEILENKKNERGI